VLLFLACASPAAVHVACFHHHVCYDAFELLVQQHQQGFGVQARQQQLQGTCTRVLQLLRWVLQDCVMCGVRLHWRRHFGAAAQVCVIVCVCNSMRVVCVGQWHVALWLAARQLAGVVLCFGGEHCVFWVCV
jgi:hypothetical protein